ncbi:RidA family protein [Deinococcus peraridilitoris]|uniref:Putative translation initiation inhibitor, yjgF family n=1 Tax=Deinococcus peraridilitoris (strain DSM 19664 / LMG 22246 / CIP 109416 / KR-200) TaxID=937777 RepID=L0A3D2_DEIPD|nr:RidA family protein [Deinococcus peraridilitoris]AFZ68356.1 putative translation initiation inhibitor, yjgF family [Deinococcus peraridilitoris DSM 19664]
MNGKQNAEQRLHLLGITLPTPLAPSGNFVGSVQTGHLLFLSGKGWPVSAEAVSHRKVGREIGVEEAYGFAREVGLQLLAEMRVALGSLNRVRRVVKVLGMVNATPEFTQHPLVINGCSDVFVEVFGEAGKHARSAVGMGSLPRGFAVEIEAIVEVKAEEEE